MERLLFPFLLYYWFFGLLLPIGKWVIVAGIILTIILKMRFDAIKARISELPALVRGVALVVALLGIVGTMPTSYLYGAIGAEMGAAVGTYVDGLLGLPWPVFRLVVALVAAIVSVLALIAWALTIWWIAGGVIGFVLYVAIRFLRGKPAGSQSQS